MKRVWAVLFAIMLAVAICTSALTEGLEIEYEQVVFDETGEESVSEGEGFAIGVEESDIATEQAVEKFLKLRGADQLHLPVQGVLAHCVLAIAGDSEAEMLKHCSISL